MEEILIKSHLIITETYNEYNIKWVGKILDAKPLIENGKPIFVIIGGNGRTEINTADIKRVEKVAKKMTYPRGRTAITTDIARIYIKELDDKEKLLGVLTHNHIKKYAPMYDKVFYK